MVPEGSAKPFRSVATLTGIADVKDGDGIRIHALVSGVIPSHATLTLRTGTGKPLERKLAIAGGADEISRVTYLGFISLLISSLSGCRPFDKKRDAEM